MEYYVAIKRNKPQMYTAIQRNHKIIMWSEKNQANKNMYYMIPFT